MSDTVALMQQGAQIAIPPHVFAAAIVARRIFAR